MEKVRAIQRYLVTMIDDNQYEGVNGRLQPEKVNTHDISPLFS